MLTDGSCDSCFFFLRLARCQVNDSKPLGMPAYGWKRPSRAKTAADHPVSTAPPPKGWGRIKEVFKAFGDRGVFPKWTALLPQGASN